MATSGIYDYLFDAAPEIKRTFGNRRNWRRFLAIADAMSAELALRRLT
jgi:hypothetical protein